MPLPTWTILFCEKSWMPSRLYFSLGTPLYSHRNPRFHVSRLVILKSSWTNRSTAFALMLFVTGNCVCIAVFGVPARNAAIDGNVIVPPVPLLKLLFWKRRYSAPNLTEWRL